MILITGNSPCKRVIPLEDATMLEVELPNGDTYEVWLKEDTIMVRSEGETKWTKGFYVKPTGASNECVIASIKS